MALLLIWTLCSLSACGSGQDQTAVRVGHHLITTTSVKHWISVLKARGTNGREPGPPAPVPPSYTACIAWETASLPPPVTGHPRSQKQLKADCAFEYRRYRLKALYLLISYDWVSGEAAELGVKLDRARLQSEIATFKRALEQSGVPFRRYLGFIRAAPADIALSFELEQLSQAIEAKVVTGAASTPSGKNALTKFGSAFERKWRARTDCRAGYVVPICRQYKPPETPPELVPPTVPLTQMPNGR